MNIIKSKECLCGNTFFNFSSFYKGEALEDGYCLVCTNCYSERKITKRSSSTYIAYDYDNNLIGKSFSRLTNKKAKELKSIPDFWKIVDCDTNQSFYVFFNEFTNSFYKEPFDC